MIHSHTKQIFRLKANTYLKTLTQFRILHQVNFPFSKSLLKMLFQIKRKFLSLTIKFYTIPYFKLICDLKNTK